VVLSGLDNLNISHGEGLEKRFINLLRLSSLGGSREINGRLWSWWGVGWGLFDNFLLSDTLGIISLLGLLLLGEASLLKIVE
jgi:hypothetical protein